MESLNSSLQEIEFEKIKEDNNALLLYIKRLKEKNKFIYENATEMEANYQAEKSFKDNLIEQLRQHDTMMQNWIVKNDL
ncbi:unnamed protein product [Brachionus calyciflorus]|uniref:Uncharacterized protein n=1 Tax=Brachionus calyciflorus TaxID=104777 RepID=A0A814I7N4_9BILA|nr:unnamed protein product [Brachionus calyciflorus]